MSRKRPQKESLFTIAGLDGQTPVYKDVQGSTLPSGLEQADEKDLTRLAQITNQAHEEVSSKEQIAIVEQVVKLARASALPAEVQVADAEDLGELEAIVPSFPEERTQGEEPNTYSHAEGLAIDRELDKNTPYPEAFRRATGRRYVFPPKEEKSIYDHKGPYRGGHPIKPSSQLRGRADERSSDDPWLR